MQFAVQPTPPKTSFRQIIVALKQEKLERSSLQRLFDNSLDPKIIK